jgi:hypothetical protein
MLDELLYGVGDDSVSASSSHAGYVGIGLVTHSGIF